LEALSLLPESLRFQAIFVGEGDNLAAYREKAKTLNLGSKVTFTGYKPSARSYIKECDLLVSASLSEGAAPLAILEAFAEKTLVLASDTPENKDSIEEAKNGFLFRSGNASDLSEKMESCLLYEDDGRITTAAHELFRNRYLFEQTCESYLKLYECCRNEGH
jgi:glycosyltransferase involved in cell wall biosynthesis